MSRRQCLVACLVGLWATSAFAGIVVNVDFNSDRGQGEYAGRGAYPSDTGTFWNQSEPVTNPTLANLVASDGTTETAIGVTITGASGVWGNTIIASALLSDYIYTDLATANITLSGLTPNGSYTLYLYSVGDQPGQGAAFTFGDITSECAGGALLEDFLEGQNYVVMNLVANERGELVGTFTNASSSPRNGGISGIQIIEVLPSRIASAPVPADTAVDVPRDGTMLGWTPSIYAGQHDVYFGTSLADVNDADVGSDACQGRQDANALALGRLEFGRTYYWRVDEVNATADRAVFKGDVWSFTVEPALYVIQNIVASASIPTSEGAGGPETTVDGSGLVEGQHSTADPDMWSGVSTPGEPAWIRYDFDRIYKVYQMHVWNFNGRFEMFLGFGLKDIVIEYATEPDAWMVLGEFQLAWAPSEPTYTGQTLDLGGIAARSIRININSSQGGGSQYGLSEVQFFQKPVFAREPRPADGATEVSHTTSLSWRPGREAASHQVRLSTDGTAVADGTALAETVAGAIYDPGVLDLGTTYYWKVDEVNEVESPGVWNGDVWSFTTQQYVPIDDFESYTDEDGSQIFVTWLDGYDVPANSALVGHDTPPYAETTYVHGGRQAMPLYYDNTTGVANSETQRFFTPPQDWTANGADALSLYFRGEPTGFHAVSESNIIMNGTGRDIWDTTDEFRFVYKQLTGNGSIVARVEHLDYTHEWAKAGVMIRATLDSDAPLVDAVVSASRRVCLQWRTAKGVDMASPDAGSNTAPESFAFPYWVKLTRAGNLFTIKQSADGVAWTDIVPEEADDPTSITLEMPSTVYIGLAVSSHDTEAAAGAQFTGVATTGNVSGQWQSASIGTTQAAGNGVDTFYIAVEDSAGTRVRLTHPSLAAVAAGTYRQWSIPLSDLAAAGLDPSSVRSLYLGVGDETKPSQNASGILYIDDIAFGHPIAVE